MRASVSAERAGIPTVSIVCEGFERQARATARGHGFDDLPLAVTVGHVDAQSAAEMTRNFVEVTFEQVVAGGGQLWGFAEVHDQGQRLAWPEDLDRI